MYGALGQISTSSKRTNTDQAARIVSEVKDEVLRWKQKNISWDHGRNIHIHSRLCSYIPSLSSAYTRMQSDPSVDSSRSSFSSIPRLPRKIANISNPMRKANERTGLALGTLQHAISICVREYISGAYGLWFPTYIFRGQLRNADLV